MKKNKLLVIIYRWKAWNLEIMNSEDNKNLDEFGKVTFCEPTSHNPFIFIFTVMVIDTYLKWYAANHILYHD